MTEDRKGTRLRWRFSLSTLLLVITVLSVWLAVRFHREPLAVENLSQLQERERIDLDIWKVVWSPDGGRIALVGWEQPVEIRDSVTLWRTRTIGEGKKIIHFAFSPDKDIVAYCENGKKPTILQLSTGQERELDTVAGQSKPVFSPDGTVLATGTYGTKAWLWDTKTGDLLKELDVGSTKGGLTPAFSPDGTLVAIGNRNATTHIFDVSSGEQVQVLSKRQSQEIAFHPTLPVIAVAYVDASIGLWNIESGELLHLVKTTAEEIYTLDWSPDGEILASGGLRGDINLWAADDLRLLHTLPGPEWLISVRFRPDGRGLVTAGGSQQPGGERYVQQWEVPLFGGQTAASERDYTRRCPTGTLHSSSSPSLRVRSVEETWSLLSRGSRPTSAVRV